MVVYNLSASPDFSSVLDLTGVVDTRRTSIEMNGCSTAFSSAEDTASFTIRNIESPLRSNAITMLLDAYENGTDLYGRIMDNGEYLFSGMVDLGGISLTSTSLAGPVTVKLVDLGRKYLDVAPKRNIVIENVKISTVVSTLLGYAGCTVGTISIAGDDDATLPCFVVDRDGNETYRNILDRLLLETGLYYLWFDSQGRCNVSAVTLSADSGVVPNYRISSGLQTTGSQILESKGLRVQWSTAAVKADQIIYVDNISKNLSEDGRSVIGTEILKDSYYPVDGDVDPIYQEYSVDFLDRPYMSGASRKKNTDLSLLMARDVTAYLQFTDEQGRSLNTDDCIEYPASPFTEEPVNPIMYAKKAFILMRALQDCYILHFQLKGTIRYRDVSYISSIGDTSSDPIDYTSEYIFSKAQAEKFAQRYWQMKQMSRLVHKWTDLDDLAIGSIVQIAHRDTAVSQYAYIVSRTSSFVGGLWQYEYTAVSIGSWNAGSVATRGSSLEKGRQGDVTIQYAWSSSSTIPPVDGWTAQPTERTDAKPYQWMRTSTDDGVTWAYSCITGADGLTVQYEYQYGDSATTPPTGQWYTADEFPYVFETYNIVWGSSTCLYDGDNMVMAADAVRGTYLWQRISSDGGTTWTYIRLTGEAGADAKYFGVACDTSTFTQNLRSSGSDSVALRLDTSGYASVTGIQWYRKYASGDAYSVISGANSATYTETIAHINSWDKIYYKVVATCDGESNYRELVLSAVKLTIYDRYFGEVNALPTGEIYVSGDYFLASEDFSGTDGNSYLAGTPYYYDGSSWYNELTSGTAKIITCLGGVMNSAITVPSTSALYGWFENLATYNLFAQAINILTGGYVRGGERYTDDANGTISDWSVPGFWFGADGRLMASLQSDNNGNTFIGTDAGSNTVIGETEDATGNYNTAMGYMAMYSNTTGDKNVAIGYMAMYVNTTGYDNIAIGNQALYANTTGTYNVGIGYHALYSNTTGTYNVGIGDEALYSNTTGTYNIAIGHLALYSNDDVGYANYNIAIGYMALYANKRSRNTAIGYRALAESTVGNDNVAIGYLALRADTTGSSNTAIGQSALYWVTTGSENLGIGSGSQVYSPTGHRQININDSLYFLSFSSTRTGAEIYTALHHYYSSSVGTRTVGAMGVFDGSPVVALGFTSNSVIIYARSSTLATLTSSTTNTYSTETLLFFVEPRWGATPAYDCLTT